MSGTHNRGTAVLEAFGHRRAALAHLGVGWRADQTLRDAIDADLTLAVGFLLGGGMPGCAAAVSVLAERLDPKRNWPWSALANDDEPEAGR